jgi:hypothetical protein
MLPGFVPSVAISRSTFGFATTTSSRAASTAPAASTPLELEFKMGGFETSEESETNAAKKYPKYVEAYAEGGRGSQVRD